MIQIIIMALRYSTCGEFVVIVVKNQILALKGLFCIASNRVRYEKYLLRR